MSKLFSTFTDCEQGEGELGHPISLLLIGCNKVLGLLVMVYLAYRSVFMFSYCHFNFHPLKLIIIFLSSYILNLQKKNSLSISFISSPRFQMILIRFSLYLLTLHDNELWFSEIMVG